MRSRSHTRSSRCLLAQVEVVAHRLGQAVGDRRQRVERRERVLEHELHAAAERRASGAAARLVMSAPSKVIVPAVGSSRRSSTRPSVDFPEPDSPTRPTVWPGCDREVDAVDRAHVTDGAAQHAAPDREVLRDAGARQQRAGAVAAVSRSWPSSCALPARGRRRGCSGRGGRRRRSPARPAWSRTGDGVRAARVEATARRHVDGGGHDARGSTRAARRRRPTAGSPRGGPRCTGAGGGRTAPRPWLPRRPGRRTSRARASTGRRRRRGRGSRRSPPCRVRSCSERSRSRIWAWTVTSSAVVGSSAMSSRGSHDNASGDQRALAHAARELVRVVARGGARGRGCRRARGARAARAARRRLAHRAVQADRVDQLRADGERGVEARHRVLEHHRDLGRRAPRASR